MPKAMTAQTTTTSFRERAMNTTGRLRQPLKWDNICELSRCCLISLLATDGTTRG